MVATPVAGLLLDFCGWPWVFYLYGAVGLAYSFAVMRFGADSPSAHRGISEEERAYILASLGQPSKVSLATVERGCAVWQHRSRGAGAAGPLVLYARRHRRRGGPFCGADRRGRPS